MPRFLTTFDLANHSNCILNDLRKLTLFLSPICATDLYLKAQMCPDRCLTCQFAYQPFIVALHVFINAYILVTIVLAVIVIVAVPIGALLPASGFKILT
ncbi:hypothetical protein KC323_g281 [Hortaea werneckii]|nr:hypothetical protein KC323_g281 [Hortaea werneckii]KAI7360072.1 hypothetical protein KC320_g225 [Hortaea werneckii]